MREAAELVRPLFEAVNARDEAALEALCEEQVEIVLLPVEIGGRRDPYAGHRGLREFLRDVEADWEQLLLTPGEVQHRGDVALVSGRVHARSRELGLRDLPAAWMFRVREGRIASARVFAALEDAIEAAGAEGPAGGGSA